MTESENRQPENPVRFVGCCGACCRTCKPFVEGFCKGCKLGYDTGERDISKARCPMKVCCFGQRNLETCADCPDYSACTIISGFYDKKGYKYKKYRQSIEFIRKNGYKQFLEKTRNWKGPYGTLG
ncbi:MAG: hypothetical protein APR53_03085 [Methanoculleus sp. SDB]|nr:MAG: hypothetical protein APR53_03085 [Methanoculleus sp. SDB]